MNWSITLGKIAGIKIRLHGFFILFAIMIIAMELISGGIMRAIFSAALMFGIFGSVVLHELGHSLMAMHYGIGVRDIILLPIGGVASLTDIPENPSIEMRIAIAGPMVNILLIGIAVPILFFFGTISPFLTYFLFYFIQVNGLMFLFNLLPAFPLDGGRIYRSYLARKYGFLIATEKAAKLGKFLAILLGVLAFLQMLGIIHLWQGLNLFTIIIAFFLYEAGESELRMVRLKHFFDNQTMVDSAFLELMQAFEREPYYTIYDKDKEIEEMFYKMWNRKI